MVGKIFLAKIYFTDRTNFKIRPIFVIKEFRDEDIIYLPLTTKLDIEGFPISASDFDEGRIPKSSILIVQKIGILHKKLLTRELGKLKPEIFKKIMKTFCTEFHCEELLKII